MAPAAKSRKHISNAERKRMIDKARFMLFKLGLTQKEVANEIGISEPAMNRWVKKLGWREKLKGKNRSVTADEIKMTDSLSAFIVFLKKKHPEQHNEIESHYKQYIKRY